MHHTKKSIMPTTIIIPTPCHQNWDAMLPQAQGRHCNACSKIVIDFTTWHMQDILSYFKSHKNTCGRFTETQLNTAIPTPQDFVAQLYYLPISTLKKIAAIFMFAFVLGTSSCAQSSKGQMQVKTIQPISILPNSYVGEPVAIPTIDTTKKTIGRINRIKGKPALKGTVKPNCKPKPVKTLLGDTILIQPKTIGAPTLLPTKPTTEPIIMGKMIMPKNK